MFTEVQMAVHMLHRASTNHTTEYIRHVFKMEKINPPCKGYKFKMITADMPDTSALYILDNILVRWLGIPYLEYPFRSKIESSNTLAGFVKPF